MESRDPVNTERYKHYVCPGCGTEVRVGSAGCPHCNPGADEDWSIEANEEGLDLPKGYAGADDFDYEAFVQREFGDTAAERRRRNMSLLRQGLREVGLGVALMLIGIALLWMLLTV